LLAAAAAGSAIHLGKLDKKNKKIETSMKVSGGMHQEGVLVRHVFQIIKYKK
jgi:hypothetical protein